MGAAGLAIYPASRASDALFRDVSRFRWAYASGAIQAMLVAAGWRALGESLVLAVVFGLVLAAPASGTVISSLLWWHHQGGIIGVGESCSTGGHGPGLGS